MTQVYEIDNEKRPIVRSLQRGALGRCPACGQGRLFRAYLKPVDTCAECGEDLHHQRADDMPAYITIVIVGHIIVAGILAAQDIWPDLSMTAQMVIWPVLTIILTLLILQPVKGALIGYQWAMRMHGFEGSAPAVKERLKGRRE